MEFKIVRGLIIDLSKVSNYDKRKVKYGGTRCPIK